MKSSDAEMAERKALVGSTTTMTFFSQAIAHLGREGQGRHADAAKASVSGAEPSVRYPRQPSTSPWSSDISGVEPPLGVDLEYVEPCGTPAEVEESIANASSAVLVSGEDDAGVTAVCHPAGDAPAPPAVSPFAVGGANPNVIAAHPPEPEAPVHARAGVDDAASLVMVTQASEATLLRGRKL